MRIFFLSDIHGFHDQINVPVEADMIIFPGDITHDPMLYQNEREFYAFKNWLYELPIEHKIVVAGNHDQCMLNKNNRDDLKAMGIIYLENESVTIDGLKIYGSPVTPTFGNWFFMCDRGKIEKYWKAIDKDTDILVTHGPPYGVLDWTEDSDRTNSPKGCKSLMSAVDRIKPLIHVFGHIHNTRKIINNGVLFRDHTTFINASCVTDGKFDMGVTSMGYIIEIIDKKIISIKKNK